MYNIETNLKIPYHFDQIKRNAFKNSKNIFPKKNLFNYLSCLSAVVRISICISHVSRRRQK